MADLTHNIYWNAANADLPLYRLLSEIFRHNLQRNTLIVVFSDHGIRFGSIRQTRSGQIEERMPFIYLYVPDELNLMNDNDNHQNNQAEQLRRILRHNSHRLTCHFDLHATLKHIIDGKAPGPKALNVNDGEPYGRSLFTIIPANRTCEQAGISENWCLCSQYGSYGNDNNLELSKIIVKRLLAEFIVWKINRLLLNTNDDLDDLHRSSNSLSAKCAPLVLDRLEHLAIRTEPKPEDDNDVFTIQIRTQPGGGLFDATVRLNVTAVGIAQQLMIGDHKKNINIINIIRSILFQQTPKIIKLMGDISRLNKYGHQSDCIDENDDDVDSIREKYCFCKVYINNLNKYNQY